MVSLTEGSGVANTLASDTEKESTSGTDTLALSRHMPTRKKVIINMQLNSLLKLFFIRTSPFQSESHLLYYIIFSRGNKEKIYVKMYILQCLTIQCEIGKIHINICIWDMKMHRESGGI